MKTQPDRDHEGWPVPETAWQHDTKGCLWIIVAIILGLCLSVYAEGCYVFRVQPKPQKAPIVFKPPGMPILHCVEWARLNDLPLTTCYWTN